MQLVSYIADEPWSDHPACTCPVLTALMRFDSMTVSARMTDKNSSR